MTPESTKPGCVSIGDGVKLTGKIDLPGIAHVDGHVEGEVFAKELRVGVTGRIAGLVIAAHADIHGELEDDLTVTDTLVLRSSSKVRGTVTYEVIEIEQGAIVEGSLKRSPDNTRAKPPSTESVPSLVGPASTEFEAAPPSDPILDADS